MQIPESKSRRAWAFDLLISLLALSGLAISAYWGFSLGHEAFAASDLKTLYASVWCFAHGQNAYAIPNLQAVFTANGVVQPPTWYGHAPVYPPPTLMLLAPLVWLPMVPALYAALTLFVVLLAWALASMLQYAAQHDGAGFVAKAGMVALFAAGPLLGFALTMGNLSLAAAALAILTFMLRRKASVWMCAAILAAALLLKPHIALWLAVGLVLLPERRSRDIVVRALTLVAVAVCITVGLMVVTRTFGLQVHGYQDILRAEMSGAASMSPASHEPLPVIAQITSLASLLGFWMGDSGANRLLTDAALLVTAVFLGRLTRRQQTEQGVLLAAGAWLAFGMLATYHRAHDAIVLLLLLPWALARVKRAPREWPAWVVLILYGAMSIGPGLDTLTGWTTKLSPRSVETFVVLRQGGLAEVCLFAVLLVALHRMPQRTPGHSAEDASRLE